MYKQPYRSGLSAREGLPFDKIAMLLVVVFLLGLCLTVSIELRQLDDATLRVMTTLYQERYNEVYKGKPITPSVEVRAAATLRDYPITMLALVGFFLLYSWWCRRAGYQFQAPLCALFTLLGISTSTRVLYEGFYGLTGEAGFILLGCIVMPITFFLAMRLRMQLSTKAFRMVTALILLMVGLNIITIFVGDSRNGSYNWITLGGISLQPSEFVKAGLIVLGCCAFITTRRKLLCSVLSILGCITVALSSDIGAVVIFGCLFIVMTQLLYDEEWLSLLIITLGVAAFVSIILLSKNKIISETAYRRMQDWGDAMTNKNFFQQKNFITATVLGGWKGLGIANAEQFFKIYAGGTDGVLACVQAVYGLPMLLVTMGCYIVIILQCGFNRGTTPSCHLFLTQIAVFFTVQVLLNYGGSLDVLPFTGIVAPLMSQGGSSTLCTMALMGIMFACLAHKTTISTKGM